MAANRSSEAAKERKARKANVTSSEFAALTEQVEENIHISNAKFTDSVTNAKKNEILKCKLYFVSSLIYLMCKKLGRLKPP